MDTQTTSSMRSKLLERHDAPATVFIATGMLDEPSFWWDVLSELAFGSDDPQRGASRGRPSDSVSWPAARHARVPTTSTRLTPLSTTALSPRTNDEIAEILGELSAQLGVTPKPSGRPLTTGELHQLASHPLITIGIHTVNHRRLTLLSPEEVRRELTDGASRLDDLLGAHRRVLAYPYGATSPAVVGDRQVDGGDLRGHYRRTMGGAATGPDADPSAASPRSRSRRRSPTGSRCVSAIRSVSPPAGASRPEPHG